MGSPRVSILSGMARSLSSNPLFCLEPTIDGRGSLSSMPRPTGDSRPQLIIDDRSSLKSLKAKERHLSSQFPQLAKIIQGNNLMVKVANYGRKKTLPLKVVVPLPSSLDFCGELVEVFKPITDEVLQSKEVIFGKYFDPILQSKRIYVKFVLEKPPIEGQFYFLRYLFQHGRCVPSVQRMQQALKGFEQQFSFLVKDVKDLKREEEANYEQSNRRNLGGHPKHDNQWGYSNFSPHANFMSIILMIDMIVIDLELEMVIMIYLAKEFQEMMLEIEEIM
ncbi:hypothetical protein M9H77_06884 [Catharanthus roseus]|uniref:Uncharacterized protein n=1 Tax=Catharanthus roseus TaxID=4058 RepID=A0ACC0BTD1_CATRO|nr:hypothetical protein M9H77_06884 [Catharanthus roseus]